MTVSRFRLVLYFGTQYRNRCKIWGSLVTPHPFFDAPLTEIVFLHMQSYVCCLSSYHHIPLRTIHLTVQQLIAGQRQSLGSADLQVFEVNDRHYCHTHLIRITSRLDQVQAHVSEEHQIVENGSVVYFEIMKTYLTESISFRSKHHLRISRLFSYRRS